jgi:adenosine deaminase
MTPEQVRRAPKVLLHDHLDGGLRPATLVELADTAGYGGLPTTDPAELAGWFAGSHGGSALSSYLQGFSHTVAVMQTAGHLQRVARECAEDLSQDGSHARPRPGHGDGAAGRALP